MKLQYDLGSALYQEAREARKNGDLKAAIQKLRRSGKLAPHFKTYELLGESFFEMERFPEAILYLAAAAALGNKQFRSRYLLAKALLAIDEEADAISKLKEAIEIQPTYKAAKELLNGILSTSK